MSLTTAATAAAKLAAIGKTKASPKGQAKPEAPMPPTPSTSPDPGPSQAGSGEATSFRPPRPARPAPRRPGRRETLAALLEDPRYLEAKQQLGEPLTPSERARLDAWRAASAQPEGGGA